MLGPALTDLLRTLAETPEMARTPDQQALFVELAALLPPPTARDYGMEATAMRVQAAWRPAIEEMGIASVTRPKTGSGGKCRCCGQTLPQSFIPGA